jgi:lipopolysaccharide export system protein LptC
MTVAPMELGPRPERRARADGPATRRAAPDQAAIARRRWMVTIGKRVLPAVAVALLISIAIWPEIDLDAASRRLSFRRSLVEPDSGELTRPRYNGIDEHGQPYTITADRARQVSQERINLIAPVGDLTLSGGDWLFARGARGVYIQGISQLDLEGDVTLYRDDGITMSTDSMTMDLRRGAASSDAAVHVEGPFGVLDAQGVAMVDRGAAVQFQGPARLLLNAASHGQTKDKPAP